MTRVQSKSLNRVSRSCATAPRLYPNKLIMLGANYLDHTREDADYADFDKASKAPCLFMKPCRIVAWRGSRLPCRHKPKGS